jgi:hypothetical protein
VVMVSFLHDWRLRGRGFQERGSLKTWSRM